MKSVIVTLATLIAIPVFACIPDGRLLSKVEKKSFATALAQHNSKCSLLIATKIGKISSENVSVFLDAKEMTRQYTVQSSKGKIRIEAVKIATGKSENGWTYKCGKIGPIARGGC